MVKIGAIIQARMSSKRFPGKVLHKVDGKPMLEYLLERLDHCNCLDKVVVATSTDDSDTPISNYCQTHDVACHRGSLFNVASRFKETLDIYKFDCFVRVNGDSPLLDQGLIEQGIEIFIQSDFDLVTNTLVRTYPKGQSVEILRSDIFKSAYQLMQKDEELEHVTSYFYKNKYDFNVFNFESAQNLSGIQLSVDTPQDLEIFALIISKMNRPHWEYDLNDILSFYKDMPILSQKEKDFR